MKFFRIRLILALVAGNTLASVASTFCQVLAHKPVLRRELESRTAWLSTSRKPDLEKTVTGGETAEIAAVAARLLWLNLKTITRKQRD
jgi:hypothetical protein